MKKLWLGLCLLPMIASAQSNPNFTPGSVLTAQALNSAFQGKVDVSTLGQANGPAQLNSSGLLPTGDLQAGQRVWTSGANDTINPSDQNGIVVFSIGSVSNTIMLSATATPVVADVVCIGSASCTLEAAATGCLNGTTNGYVVLANKTMYHVVMADNLGTPCTADWYVK